MSSDPLKILAHPNLNGGRMVLAFTGWMDGGDVSTGSVDWLVNSLAAEKVAEIDPDPFYIYNFPGSMELSSLFRPEVLIEDGMIEALEFPENIFYADAVQNIVLFKGKEPNYCWRQFADAIFAVAEELGVSTLYFVGSYAGMVPHTRDPRITSSVSHPELRKLMEQYGIKFANYEGPASFSTYLIREAPKRGLQMVNLVAEIPAYVESTNPKCIEMMVRKMGAILDLPVTVDALRSLTETWEKRVNEALDAQDDMLKYISKLEEDYDNEVFDTEMGDLKEWLQRRGIRVD